jgi:hypothetical protein
MTTSPAATAPTTCAVCAQPLHAEVNAVTGETQMVADDGWGTVCGDAPDGEHVPAVAECEHGLSAELCMGPDHYPSIEWEMEREHFADDISERFAGEAVDWDDDDNWGAEDVRPDGYDRNRPGPVTCTCQLDPGACPDHEPRDEDDDIPF